MPDYDAHTGGAGGMLLQLLRAGSAENARALAPQAWEAVLALALRQGVAPLLHRRLHAEAALAAVPAPVAGRLGEERRATALENLRNYGEFRRVAHALGKARIPLIALKGLHLAELVYRDISLRPMSDLDILVPRGRVADCLALLRGMGYGHDEDLLAAATAMLDTKCNIGLAQEKRGTWLEVHWALDEPRGGSTDPLPDVWRGALPARLGDAETQVLSPEFLLLHVCAHLACNHSFAFSLRALCDIAEIVQTQPALDWAAVVAHGSRHHWTRGVAATLRLARDHLGVAVPAQVLEALGGDSLDPALLADAIAQLLAATELPEGLVTAPNLLALSGSKRPREKAALMWRRLFVPRAELALLYGVSQKSPRLPLYYAVRLRDLARRYAVGAWALNVGDPALAEVAARHLRLQRWISGAPARD
jgi:hypothetical protein